MCGIFAPWIDVEIYFSASFLSLSTAEGLTGMRGTTSVPRLFNTALSGMVEKCSRPISSFAYFQCIVVDKCFY